MRTMVAPDITSALRPLLRFHLQVGGRVALQAMAPVVAAAGGAMVVVADGFPTSFVRMLFGDGAAGNLRPLLAGLSLAFASSAAPRVCRGVEGWLRHLPGRGRDHRRAAMLAVAVAQLPLLIGLSFLALIVFRGWSAVLADVFGLMVCAVAAALAVMPVERRPLVLPASLAAAALAVSGLWLLVATAVAILVVADAFAGSLRTPRIRLPRTPPARPAATAASLWLRIAWRAAAARLLSALVPGLLPLAALALFRANNTLDLQQMRLAARFGGGAAVVLLLSALAGVLAVRRPAWPWSRSLPWSAHRRVVLDAALLTAPAMAVVLLVARIDVLSALEVLAIVPLVAARAAGAMRSAPERRTGAAGEIATQGGLLAGAAAVLPWLAALALVAVPLALREAAERERAQRVSRWQERHPLAAGDPQSWSA